MSKTKYICIYCGTPEIRNTLPAWELKQKQCKICNNAKFVIKKMPPNAGNVFGYEEDSKEEKQISVADMLQDYFED